MNNEETKIPLFRRCVLQNFPFIEQDFDALTDYGLLCKVVEYLNKIIEQTNINSEQVSLLTTLFSQLKSYVDNYFANLDVQEEINNKLDQMAEDGTLQEIITAYIQANVAWCFDTVADMKSATNLVAGSYAQTLGFYAKGDGGNALYYITDTGTANEIDVIAVDSLYANLVVENSTIYTKQFGIVGDGTTDETSKAQLFFGYDTDTYIVNSPDILIDGNLSLTSSSTIKFEEGCKISRKTNNLTTYFMFLIDNKHDINIINAHLVGDRETHTGASGEYGHGINIVCSKNIKIDNCNIEQTWGDGIYVGLYSLTGTYTTVENIHISNCHIDNCSRNGISVCSGSNITVENCLIENTDRTWPKAGIDIEAEGPEGSSPALTNVYVNNVRTINNYAGIEVHVAEDYVAQGIIIDNHYSKFEMQSFIINRFDNAGNTLCYKNSYIELCKAYPIYINKNNTNVITIKDIICDSCQRTDTPVDYYGIVNFSNDTAVDGGGVILDNIQGIENHSGNSYVMYKNVVCRNNSTAGTIKNIILKNTNAIKTTGNTYLINFYGSAYDVDTIKIINCDCVFSSNYYQLSMEKVCSTQKLLSSSLAANSTLDVKRNIGDGEYEVNILKRNSYNHIITFNSDYEIYNGDSGITALDYRKFTTTTNGAYLKFKKVGSAIIILANRGYTASQVA